MRRGDERVFQCSAWKWIAKFSDTVHSGLDSSWFAWTLSRLIGVAPRERDRAEAESVKIFCRRLGWIRQWEDIVLGRRHSRLGSTPEWSVTRKLKFLRFCFSV